MGKHVLNLDPVRELNCDIIINFDDVIVEYHFSSLRLFPIFSKPLPLDQVEILSLIDVLEDLLICLIELIGVQKLKALRRIDVLEVFREVLALAWVFSCFKKHSIDGALSVLNRCSLH